MSLMIFVEVFKSVKADGMSFFDKTQNKQNTTGDITNERHDKYKYKNHHSKSGQFNLIAHRKKFGEKM